MNLTLKKSILALSN